MTEMEIHVQTPVKCPRRKKQMLHTVPYKNSNRQRVRVESHVRNMYTYVYKYIRPVKSNSATFGKWPGWSYGYWRVADTLSFPTVYDALS